MEMSNEMQTDEMLLAQTLLWSHTFGYVDSMSLKCAVELGIPDAIDSHGGTITLSELLSSISISPTKAPHLKRLMRLLTHSGFFTSHIDEGVDSDKDIVYSLTQLSQLLLNDKGAKLSKYVQVAIQPILVSSFQSMSAWFRADDETAFSLAHGCSAWEMTRRDPDFNKSFNEGMASDSQFWIKAVLKNCGQVFQGITSLVDVGGGTGSSARAINKAFPQLKCSVLDLPQVVDALCDDDDGRTIEFVAGDMFNYIPPTNAILLKSILHNWSEEECVRILKRCKEAIPSREDGGKVIIIDIVVSTKSSHEKSTEAQLYYDIAMMVLHGGAEREEQEWKKIFMEAGFSDYNVTHTLGVRSVIELYP